MRLRWEFPALADEHAFLLTYAQILCATALCDDDLHVRSVPLWEKVLAATDQPADRTEAGDFLEVFAATAYGRFCVETGRLSEAQPWLRRAGARAQANGWELATARTELERAAASWSVRDCETTERLVSQAYPVIARHARAHDVSRCWLYLGLTRLARGALQAADECWEHAERHWRELGKPLHIHRILLQRSWIAIFRGRFAEAVELIAQAREWLDSSPRSSWLQYAQLDNHLGTVWRADALTDLGFDAAGDPSETWEEAQARQASAGHHPRRGRQSGIPACGGQTRTGRRAQGAGGAGRRLGAVLDRRRRREIEVGHLHFGADFGWRLRRRLGVGEHRVDQ